MYCLGIDVGTTWTAAATWRDGRAQMVTLGSHVAAMPSVVVVRADGVVLTGEAAERRAISDPARVARQFKRRLGDPTPVLLGGEAHSPQELTAELLRAVVDVVTGEEGARPDAVLLTHPASWGTYKIRLLSAAGELAGLGPLDVIAEPEAAAIHYASTERVAPGDVVAVYDLGGGTFDAAVLRNRGTGFERLGEPSGVERLGGIDFDAAVFEHVRMALGGALDELDPDDPAAVSSAGRLRDECVGAKEALSSDVEVSIPVLLPGLSTEVRLTRAEFEDLIRPSVLSTVEALRRAVRSAGLEPTQLSRVLLVGGSSRIPLVAELVGRELGCPVTVDAHPKHAIALGAAIAAGAGATAVGTAALAAGTEVVHHLPAPPPPAAPWPVPEGPPADLGEPRTVPVVDPVAGPPGPLEGPAATWPTVTPGVGVGWTGALGGQPTPVPIIPLPADPPTGPADRPPARAGRRIPLLVATALLVVLAVAGAAVAMRDRGNGEAAADRPGTSDVDSGESDDSRSDPSDSSEPASTVTTTSRPTTTTTATTTAPLPPPGPVAVRSATASDFAPPSVDGSGNEVTYGAANTVDGFADTCWRVAGDGAGEELTFTVPGAMELTSVSLLPGYDKIDTVDGTDRWAQNRRPTAVRWTFDDGSSVDQPLLDRPEPQPLAVRVTTTTVRLAVIGATPVTDRDFVAISEVAFQGR